MNTIDPRLLTIARHVANITRPVFPEAWACQAWAQRAGVPDPVVAWVSLGSPLAWQLFDAWGELEPAFRKWAVEARLLAESGLRAGAVVEFKGVLPCELALPGVRQLLPEAATLLSMATPPGCFKLLVVNATVGAAMPVETDSRGFGR